MFCLRHTPNLKNLRSNHQHKYSPIVSVSWDSCTVICSSSCILSISEAFSFINFINRACNKINDTKESPYCILYHSFRHFNKVRSFDSSSFILFDCLRRETMKRQGQKLNLIGGSVVIYQTQENVRRFLQWLRELLCATSKLLEKEWASVSRESQRTPRNPANALYLQFTEGHLDCVVWHVPLTKLIKRNIRQFRFFFFLDLCLLFLHHSLQQLNLLLLLMKLLLKLLLHLPRKKSDYKRST